MSETSPTRRDVLATTTAAGALLLSQEVVEAADSNSAIRPFHVNVPEEKLVDLRRRITATQWPEKETVDDSIAGRAARDDAEARALLGDGLRLAQGRGAAQRPAAVHHRDRRARHSFHSRPFEA